jgi:hypothetical protein
VVLADALYFNAPFFNLCLGPGKEIIPSFKDEERPLFQDQGGKDEMNRSIGATKRGKCFHVSAHGPKAPQHQQVLKPVSAVLADLA